MRYGSYGEIQLTAAQPQKIISSESQWEKHLAYAYNVDYWDGKSQLNLAPEMIQLRYANYPKDYFMGILPNSQYGSVAILPSSYNSAYPSNQLVSSAPYDGRVVQSGSGVGTNMGFSPNPSSPSGSAVLLNSNLSALSIRATEYLQRWKEVVQFASKDYSDQMAAQQIGRAHV